MCTLLIVEDDEPKLNQLLSFLEKQFPNFQLEVARSLNAACRLVDSSAFDLILLDMSLPTFDGGKTVGASGRQQTLGGRDLLRYLWELEISTPVRVVTGFKDFPGDVSVMLLGQLDVELSRDFPENYTGHVYFTHNNDQWKIDLTSVLKGFIC
jgi:CheY-like chemotaxis protein